jgi:hypothetical protein
MTSLSLGCHKVVPSLYKLVGGCSWLGQACWYLRTTFNNSLSSLWPPRRGPDKLATISSRTWQACDHLVEDLTSLWPPRQGPDKRVTSLWQPRRGPDKLVTTSYSTSDKLACDNLIQHQWQASLWKPCGIPDKLVTTLQREHGLTINYVTCCKLVGLH